MTGLLGWLLLRREDQSALERDAMSYRELRQDIEDLQKHAADFPQVTAATLWLLRSDDLRRWDENKPKVLCNQWWGPPETFVDQLRARFSRKQRY